MAIVKRWDQVHDGPLTVEAVRALHQPPSHFRISPYRYAAEMDIAGVARACRVYVLIGSCRFTFSDSICSLRAGDVADLPAGQYELRILGDSDVEFVSVWELPPEVRIAPEMNER